MANRGAHKAKKSGERVIAQSLEYLAEHGNKTPKPASFLSENQEKWALANFTHQTPAYGTLFFATSQLAVDFVNAVKADYSAERDFCNSTTPITVENNIATIRVTPSMVTFILSNKAWDQNLIQPTNIYPQQIRKKLGINSEVMQQPIAQTSGPNIPKKVTDGWAKSVEGNEITPFKPIEVEGTVSLFGEDPHNHSMEFTRAAQLIRSQGVLTLAKGTNGFGDRYLLTFTGPNAIDTATQVRDALLSNKTQRHTGYAVLKVTQQDTPNHNLLYTTPSMCSISLHSKAGAALRNALTDKQYLGDTDYNQANQFIARQLEKLAASREKS